VYIYVYITYVIFNESSDWLSTTPPKVPKMCWVGRYSLTFLLMNVGSIWTIAANT